MQDHHPIAYISRHLNHQQQSYSTYEKELLAVVMVVQKWRHYLLNTHFIIRTDHRSLKFILNQKWTTAFQQRWLVKLMEFDFSIEYKQGHDNVVVDALSRVEPVACKALMDHQVVSELVIKIKASWDSDHAIQRKISELQANSSFHKHYSWKDGELMRKGRLVVDRDDALRQDILLHFHVSAAVGHSG